MINVISKWSRSTSVVILVRDRQFGYNNIEYNFSYSRISNDCAKACVSLGFLSCLYNRPKRIFHSQNFH